jgi:hypothetical protein
VSSWLCITKTLDHHGILPSRHILSPTQCLITTTLYHHNTVSSGQLYCSSTGDSHIITIAEGATSLHSLPPYSTASLSTDGLSLRMTCVNEGPIFPWSPQPLRMKELPSLETSRNTDTSLYPYKKWIIRNWPSDVRNFNQSILNFNIRF